MTHKRETTAVAIEQAHLVVNIILWDEWGNSYERRYAGFTVPQAVADFTAMVESDGTEIRDMSVSAATDCYFADYNAMIEGQCSMEA